MDLQYENNLTDEKDSYYKEIKEMIENLEVRSLEAKTKLNH